MFIEKINDADYLNCSDTLKKSSKRLTRMIENESEELVTRVVLTVLDKALKKVDLSVLLRENCRHFPLPYHLDYVLTRCGRTSTKGSDILRFLLWCPNVTFAGVKDSDKIFQAIREGRVDDIPVVNWPFPTVYADLTVACIFGQENVIRALLSRYIVSNLSWEYDIRRALRSLGDHGHVGIVTRLMKEFSWHLFIHAVLSLCHNGNLDEIAHLFHHIQ